jgi:hypothetical protein
LLQFTVAYASTSMCSILAKKLFLIQKWPLPESRKLGSGLSSHLGSRFLGQLAERIDDQLSCGFPSNLVVVLVERPELGKSPRKYFRHISWIKLENSFIMNKKGYGKTKYLQIYCKLSSTVPVPVPTDTTNDWRRLAKPPTEQIDRTYVPFLNK